MKRSGVLVSVLVFAGVACVPETGSDAGLDAGPGFSDSGVDAGCPGECRACRAGVCELTCTDAPCRCPAGLGCVVDVPARSGGGLLDVDCSTATSCTVRCARGSNCGDVRCGTGPCEVQCAFSCRGIDCTNASTCKATCLQDACTGAIACGGSRCDFLCSQQSASCFSSQPIVCSAASCFIDCTGANVAACLGRTITCTGGSCDVRLPPACSNITVDCSGATACRVLDATTACPVQCPAGCDAGCTSSGVCGL